jgi:NAD+ kinase
MTARRLGLVVNIQKADIKEVLDLVVSTVPGDVELAVMEEAARFMPKERVEVVDGFSSCDAVLALGGDGTLLTAARHVEVEEIPLLGIKVRSLGFLTEDDPERALKNLLSGRYIVQERMRLEVALAKGGVEREKYSALNDVVVHVQGVSRVIHLKTTIDGAFLGEYLSDGVIVSTPTGSTAYCLSAGGPIINPESVEAFVITPLYPHSLSVRPLVVSARETFTVELVEESQVTLLTIDGQQICRVQKGDMIIFRRSPHVTKLIVNEDYNFYDLVRRKLRWGGVLRKR